jgi:hypothetical protein
LLSELQDSHNGGSSGVGFGVQVSHKR